MVSNDYFEYFWATPLSANKVRSPGSSNPSTVTDFEVSPSNITSLVIEYRPEQFSYIQLRIISTLASCVLTTVFTKCGGNMSSSLPKKLLGLIFIPVLLVKVLVHYLGI